MQAITSIFAPPAADILKESGRTLPHVVIAPSLQGREAALAKQSLPGETLLLVTDETLFPICGERIMQRLGEAYRVMPLVLPPLPRPDMEHVARIRGHAFDAIAAVGSGTVNDLCKYAAFLAHKPYLAFPTAPSMNGYASANASLVENGVRHSAPAATPAAILCDLQMLARAPARLIRAGLGDSLARPTAQADWLLSHLLRETPYDSRPFLLLEPYEASLFSASEALGRGDAEAVETLMKVLLLSGFGMTLAGGSYPASQGEHMIVHHYLTLAEERLDKTREVLHGEAVGVATLTMARIQEKLVKTLPPALSERIRSAPARRPHLPRWAGMRRCMPMPWKRLMPRATVSPF